MAISAEQLAMWIDRWAGPLTAWLRVRCSDPDNIVQEAFCRLVQQQKIPERIAPWLFHVANNLVREESRPTHRRKKRESFVAKTELQVSSASQSLEDEELRIAVDSLPGELREFVIARVWGELTLAEIAGLTELSIATVSSWIRWNSIEEMDREMVSTASDPMPDENALPSETLSVRSRIPAS